MNTTHSPVATARPAARAASLPKLREKLTGTTSGRCRAMSASTCSVVSREPSLTMTSSARTFSGASTPVEHLDETAQSVRLIEGGHDHRHIDPVRTELHRNTLLRQK